MRKLQVATTCPEWPAILLKQLEPLDSVTKEPRVGSIQEGIKCDVISLASVIEMRVTPVWVSANAVVQATRVGRAESCTESGSSQSLILHPRVNLWPMNSLGIFKWLGEKPENTLYHDRWNFLSITEFCVSDFTGTQPYQFLIESSQVPDLFKAWGFGKWNPRVGVPRLGKPYQSTTPEAGDEVLPCQVQKNAAWLSNKSPILLQGEARALLLNLGYFWPVTYFINLQFH